MVAERVGSAAGLGRSNHTGDQGRRTIHQLGRRWVHSLRARALAGRRAGALVVRTDHRPAASRQAIRLADDRADRESALAIDMAGSRDDRQGWLVLAALLLVGGVTGPESFGAAHGEFLPQRVVLFGFMALVPVFDLDRSRWCGRAALASLVVAVSLQSAIVWDFGLYSEPHGRADHSRRSARGSRPEDCHAARQVTRPVSGQPAASCGKLAGGQHRQRHLEQLRGTSLLLSGSVQAGNQATSRR